MVQTVGITKGITNLNEAHGKFNLSQTDTPHFFTEWFEDLPEITDSEKEFLNRLKIDTYIMQQMGRSQKGQLTELWCLQFSI